MASVLALLPPLLVRPGPARSGLAAFCVILMCCTSVVFVFCNLACSRFCTCKFKLPKPILYRSLRMACADHEVKFDAHSPAVFIADNLRRTPPPCLQLGGKKACVPAQQPGGIARLQARPFVLCPFLPFFPRYKKKRRIVDFFYFFRQLCAPSLSFSSLSLSPHSLPLPPPPLLTRPGRPRRGDRRDHRGGRSRPCPSCSLRRPWTGTSYSYSSGTTPRCVVTCPGWGAALPEAGPATPPPRRRGRRPVVLLRLGNDLGVEDMLMTAPWCQLRGPLANWPGCTGPLRRPAQGWCPSNGCTKGSRRAAGSSRLPMTASGIAWTLPRAASPSWCPP